MSVTSWSKLDIRTVREPKNERFCVIDFETNGQWGEGCEVVEFAALKIEGGELSTQISALCEPSAPLPSFITRLTGIKPGMVIGKPRFEQYLDSFLDYIGDDIIVAHNAPFDVGILSMYCRRAGRDFNPRTLCTLTASRRLFPDIGSHALANLAELFSLKDGRSHRALSDTTVTARLLLLMFEYLQTGAF